MKIEEMPSQRVAELMRRDLDDLLREIVARDNSRSDGERGEGGTERRSGCSNAEHRNENGNARRAG